MQASLENVAKLYVATFNRAPDAAGLNYWVNSGLTLEEIAQSFFDQPETQALYPAGTPTASFVNSVYNNLFNRDAEQAGLDYWAAELNSGNVSKQHFILAVINGAQNTELGQDAQILSNKQTVGLAFVNAGLNDVAMAKTIMESIDATESSVNTSLTAIENYNSGGDITGCDLTDSPLTLEQMTELAKLAWVNDETGILSTATIREAVIAQTGSDAYYAAFEAQMGGDGCDEISTADMLGREDLANLPDTVETAESLMYGTEIHFLKNLDTNEAMAIGNFTYANTAALEAYDTAVWDQYVAMLVDAFSAMENTPAVALSGAIYYPGASLEQVIQNMVVESTVDFVGMAIDPNYVPTGMFDGYLG